MFYNIRQDAVQFPGVMGGGVQCDGGTHHAPTPERAPEGPENGRINVSGLGCDGCDGSNLTYRVACACAYVREFRVYPHHTHHGHVYPRLFKPLTPSIAGTGVMGGQPPYPSHPITPDGGVHHE